MLGKKSADDLKYFFSYFPPRISLTFHANCLKEIVCMKCQSLFSGENKKSVISLSSAEFAPGSDKGSSDMYFVFIFLPH